jgi:NAD-dependent deacetylase
MGEHDATATGDAIDATAALLRDAERVVVLSGAGISTESGIRDFRGPNGVWTKNPEAEKTATLEHYVGDRAVRVQAWRNRVDGPYWTAEPNDGHRALADIERAIGERFALLVTQNVDGLHLAAGSDPERIVEIHGNVREVKCLRCRYHAPMSVALDRVRAGEDDPADDLLRCQAEASRCDVFLALGTSLGVYPAAALPEIALTRGARLVVANAEPTPFDPAADVVSREQLGTYLTSVAAQLRA